MSVSINIRKRNEDGKTWGNIPVMSFAGRTVGCVLSEMDGREVVAEITSGNWRGYLCGTEHWVKHYEKRGLPVKSFREGVSILAKKQSPLLDAVCPGEVLEPVSEVFPGAEVELVSDALF